MNKEKICIIGAGLTGLYAAVRLQDKYEVILLEARGRVGGRILNLSGHDMGPSWVWPHQQYILELIDTLGLTRFEQYTQGYATYDAPDGVQRFHAPPSATSYRIEGGISQIVWALEKQLHSPVKCNEKVISMRYSDDNIIIKTKEQTYIADKVLSTLPPRLAVESIEYEPALPLSLETKLHNIPTWMGYSSKCVIEYPEAFWREEGVSGFGISHLGPLSEIHDASLKEKAALFGFVHSQFESEDLESKVLEQLTRMFGPKASRPSHMYIVDWKKEVFTSTKRDAQPLREHPSYGFDAKHFDAKLIFSGTESAVDEGGYLDGALHAVEDVLKYF